VVFRADLPAGAVVAVPDTLPAGLLSAFVGAIERHRHADPDARYGVLLWTPPLGSVAEPAVLLAYAVVRTEPGAAVALYGIAARERAVADLAAAWLEDEDLLPPAIARGLPNDSLVSVAVYGPGERTMFVSPVPYPATFSARDSLGHALGDLVVEASIRPDAASQLVIGGLPRSRLPVFLVLLFLTLGVGGAGLLQVRRHNELSRLREDFISSVSHELRTPLTQIRMLAELQEEGKLRTEAERLRSNKVIRREAQRLTQLVENILQFSQLRALSDGAAASRPVELGEAVPEAIAAFTPLAAANGTSVAVSVDPGLAVLAQRDGVRQIVSNLLDNALKYGPRSQTVRVRAERAAGVARISVEDEGPGIPVEERERIWEPYRRLARDVDGGRPGSGVGLAVVDALVRRYGGRVRVEDVAPTGSRFVVELPLAETGATSQVAAGGVVAAAGA
jgi:signal transduction histidine kinase